MTTEYLIRELEKLPLPDKLLVIEQTLRSIRMERQKKTETAAEALFSEYQENNELTIFTQLDDQPFYETR